jgi:hypothetical protein
MDYREVGNPTHEEVITGNMKPNPYNVKKKKKKKKKKFIFFNCLPVKTNFCVSSFSTAGLKQEES